MTGKHIINHYRQLLRRMILMCILLLGVSTASLAQSGLTEAIGQSLKAGDASGVSRYFGPSVDITINNSTSTYSRTQGELVLRDFFSKNPVRDFDIQHSANSSDRPATFTIGYLSTNTGKYRVYMWLKPRDGGYVLKEIRFER